MSDVLEEQIGSGAFGTVCKYFDKSRDELTALKKLCFEECLIIHQWTDIPKILQEVDHSKKVIHDNVVQCISSWLDGPNISEIEDNTYKPPNISSTSHHLIPRLNFLNIQMELCDTSLDKWITSSPNPEFSPTSVFTQLCSGLSAIHGAFIVHQDLHPGNIFIKGAIWKVGDFGLARTYGKEISAARGNILYRSPEMKQPGRGHYGYGTDIYSLGLIFLYMLNSRVQNDDYFRSGLFYELREGQEYEKAVSDAGVNVLQEFSVELATVLKMLKRNPDLRLSLEVAAKSFSDPAMLSYMTKALDSTRVCKNPDVFSNPRNIEVIVDFFGRETRLAEIIDFLNDDYHTILIQGEQATGKSLLVKQIAQNIRHDSSIAWIDCSDIVENYKHFCDRFKGSLTKRWIIIFDGLEKKFVGCFGIIFKALISLKLRRRPSAIIVTTNDKNNVANFITDLYESQTDVWERMDENKYYLHNYVLDYEWIAKSIHHDKLELHNLFQLIFAQKLKDEHIGAEDVMRISQLCESFRQVSLMKNVNISRKLETSISLIVLLAITVSPNKDFHKSEFLRLWDRFRGKPYSFIELDAVLNHFMRSGIIIVSQSISNDGQNLSNSVNACEISCLFANSDKWLITLCPTLLKTTVVKHPLFISLMANHLGILGNSEIEGELEFAIYKKLVETLHDFIPSDETVIHPALLPSEMSVEKEIEEEDEDYDKDLELIYAKCAAKFLQIFPNCESLCDSGSVEEIEAIKQEQFNTFEQIFAQMTHSSETLASARSVGVCLMTETIANLLGLSTEQLPIIDNDEVRLLGKSAYILLHLEEVEDGLLWYSIVRNYYTDNVHKIAVKQAAILNKPHRDSS